MTARGTRPRWRSWLADPIGSGLLGCGISGIGFSVVDGVLTVRSWGDFREELAIFFGCLASIGLGGFLIGRFAQEETSPLSGSEESLGEYLLWGANSILGVALVIGALIGPPGPPESAAAMRFVMLAVGGPLSLGFLVFIPWEHVRVWKRVRSAWVALARLRWVFKERLSVVAASPEPPFIATRNDEKPDSPFEMVVGLIGIELLIGLGGYLCCKFNHPLLFGICVLSFIVMLALGIWATIETAQDMAAWRRHLGANWIDIEAIPREILDPIKPLIPAGRRRLRRSELREAYAEATRLAEERERFARTRTIMVDWENELALAEARETYLAGFSAEECAALDLQLKAQAASHANDEIERLRRELAEAREELRLAARRGQRQ